MASITALTKNKKGQVRWQARVRVVGKLERTVTFDTEEQAIEWATRAENAPVESTNVLDNVTAGELIERYVDTVGASKRASDKFLASPLASMYLSEITPELIADLAAEWIMATPRKIPAPLLLLRDAWDDLQVDHPTLNLPANPVTALKLTKVDTKNRRLSVDEENIIRESFKDARGGYLDQAMTVALETALLQKDIVSLDWNEINFATKKITVGNKTIPVSEKLVEALMSLNPRANGQVFHELTTVALHRAFKRRLEKLGIDDLTFNDLRNEAIHRFKESGMTKEQLQRVLGYKTGTNLDRIFDEQE